MSRRLVIVNLILLGVGVFFATELVRELTASRPLPPPPVPREAQAGEPAAPDGQKGKARPDQLAEYGVIAAKTLFSPTRSEAVVAGAGPAAPPPAPRPILHGVVLADGQSRAYLEDAASKRVFGYAVGDPVGGGRLEAIRDDRVVIARPEGSIEVLLRDPAKPRPAAPPVSPPGPGAAVPPGTRRTPVPVPGAPPTAPMPFLQGQQAQPAPVPSVTLPIPSQLLRRPGRPPATSAPGAGQGDAEDETEGQPEATR
jgi:hypothetical protein